MVIKFHTLMITSYTVSSLLPLVQVSAPSAKAVPDIVKRALNSKDCTTLLHFPERCYFESTTEFRKNISPNVVSKFMSGLYTHAAYTRVNTRINNTYLRCQIMKWDKVVPYRLANDLTDKLKVAIEDAVKTWNNTFKDCIEFKKRKSEEDFLTFHGGLACYSSVGRKPGEQIIMLDSLYCSTFGKIAHEMMHVIGFQHEHMRSDRDKYIKVNYENIPPDWHNEFRTVTENFHFGELGPYDYQSVMHYRVLSPDNRRAAYEVLEKGIDEDRIGNQLNLTDIDKIKVRKLYCPDSKQAANLPQAN